MDGLTIDGARGKNTTRPFGTGLIDIETSGIVIRDCHVQNYVNVGIRITGGSNHTSANVRIEDNFIENVYCGISASEASNNLRLSGNRIRS